MSQIWKSLPRGQYLSLVPWAWVQLESADPPGPFPFIAGVAPEVVASLQEVHGLLSSALDTAISDVFSKRAPLDDPDRRRRLEDAYAEVVSAHPYLATAHSLWTEAGRDVSMGVSNRSHQICHGHERRAPDLPFREAAGDSDWVRPAPVRSVGGKGLRILGRHASRLTKFNTVVATSGRDGERILTRLIESLHQHECLVSSSTSSVRSRWFETLHDQDMIHLGHAALLYRQRDQALLFDPWLLPWFAESSVPSLWGSLLPKPAAVFLTHDHDDHVDPRTLLHLPKDTPIIVPSRRNRRTLFYDYLSLLRELGFGRVIELAHGESWAFEGGAVYAVPFYGEDPCDLEMPRNCYLIADRGYNVLVHADSGPTNSGRSALKDGVIQSLVRKHGSIPLVFASQQQLLEIRGHAAHAPLSHPGKWLDVGENGYLTNAYLAEVCAAAQAKLFVSYATGGAEWYPDHLSFMFSQRNPARTALLTAHWERPEMLKELLVTHGCGYHYGHALDLFRRTTDGLVEPLTTGEALTPLSLYRLDHGDPPFMKAERHTTASR